MGIKERQERDREAVHRAILDAARGLFVSEGYSHVSIRKIAERIEYSPAAIYGYFSSKDDIFFALAEEGFRLLHGSSRDAMLDALPPLDRVRAIFMRLYHFSVEHPEYFSLMFIDRAVPRIGREYERFAFAHEMKAYLIDQVQECVDRGILPSTTSPLVAFRMLATSVVGVAVMRLSDRLTAAENAEDLVRDVIDIVVAGLQSGIPIRSSAHTDPCLLAASTEAANGTSLSSEEPHS